ncbi:YrdB family protein [Fibrella forsythiae]|uniref:YrdB family protein n=1 Tax=Fibrella forsythiae TaxID=2817061 RepID=A0ABS3JN74_9BACT|nr:YrdB family protein [Fibrella forsythiae]
MVDFVCPESYRQRADFNLITYPAILYAGAQIIQKPAAFSLELVMIAPLSVKNSQSLSIKWLAGIGMPLVAIVLWGIFAAPRSAHRPPLPYQILFSWALFSMVGYMLYQTGHKTTAFVFCGLAFGSGLIAYFTER